MYTMITVRVEWVGLLYNIQDLRAGNNNNIKSLKNNF